MPVIITGTIDTYSKSAVDVKLTSHFTVSYCERSIPKTEVLVTVGLGEVKRTDSLYGFNFAIKYDRSKLYFNSTITTNTLSEFASYAHVSFGLEYGKLFGAGINNTPLTGNKELIGFYGDYIGDLCNDSALVEIEYIEFTDEYQKSVNKLDTIWIKPVKNDVTYNAEIKFPNNEYIYDSTITNILPIEMNFSKVKYLDVIGLNIYSENQSYNLIYKNINDNFKINEIAKTANSISLQIENIKNIDLSGNIRFFDIELTKNINETDTNSRIFVKPIKLSDCDCFDDRKVTNDSIRIKYIRSNVTNVEDIDNSIEVTSYLDKIQVNSNFEIIKRIQLFNSVGNIVVDEFIDNSNYYTDNIFSNGVYLVRIWTDKQVINKKILINN